MALLPQRTLTFVCVLVVFLATCIKECSSQAQPQIRATGLFVVGRERTLSCFVTSTEDVAAPLSWSRGGSTFPATREEKNTVSAGVFNYNSFYTFVVQASDNEEVFECTANFPSGITSARWTVRVFQGPNNPVISGPSQVVSGVSSTWTCVVDGASSTAPNVYWQFGNGTRVGNENFNNVANVYTDSNNLEIHKETSTLTLTISAGAPSFDLACYAIHFDTNQQKVSTLPVTVSYPPVIAGGNISITVTAGSTFTIDCVVTATPSITSLTWYKNGVVLDVTSGRYSGGTYLSPSLTISNIVKADGGAYQCEATNGIGTTRGGVNTLTTRYIPIVTAQQNPVGGVLGGSVAVSCVIDAFPQHTTVRWYKVDVNTGLETAIITSNSAKYSGSTVQDPDLTINSLANSDAGFYRCKVDNNVGRGEGPNVQLQVNYAPILQVTSPLTATEPNPVTLTVTVDALPGLTSVTWYKGGQPLNTAGGGYSGGTTSSPSLTINNVGPGDAGTYYVSAANSVGTTNSDSILLNVLYAPSFTIPSTQVGGTIGGSVTLALSVAANPAVTSLQWRKRSDTDTNVYTPISNSSSRFSYNTANPSLTISNLEAGDIGNYTLVAQNSIGERQSLDFMVAVSYTPTTPVISGLSNSYREGNQISLTCTSNGFPQPLYRWLKNGVNVGTSSVLTIPSASVSDNGAVFTCEAYNDLGTTQASTIPTNVQYIPRASTLRNVTASIPQTVTLQCNVDANPPVPATSYSWTYNGQVLNSNTNQLTVTVSNSSDFGPYYCSATNTIGTSDGIPIFVKPSGDDPLAPNPGASTEDSGGLPIATIVLICIICIIILVVLLLICIYCCASRGYCKKKNAVANTAAVTAAPAPVVAPAAPVVYKPRHAEMNGTVIVPHMNGNIKVDEDKTPNGTAPDSHNYGLLISVPGGGTPRPHHLPPLGEDGLATETEPAQEEKQKKKRRKKKKRRHHDEEEGGGGESPSRHRHHNDVNDYDYEDVEVRRSEEV